MLAKLIGPLSLLAALELTSCGSDANLNALLFSRDHDKNRVDYIVKKAQAAYNRGDFTESLELIESSGEPLTQGSEELLELKASNEIAIAGFQLFEFVGNIIEATDSDASSTSSSSLALSASDTGDILNSLSKILTLTEEDFGLIGEESNLPDNEILKDYRIFLPNQPGSHLDQTSPRFKNQALLYINKAIKTLCPLISEDLRETDGEISHIRYDCEPFEGEMANPAKSYFLYFLSHLVEGLIFNSILLYSNDTNDANLTSVQDNSNVFKRINAVSLASKNVTIENLAEVSEATTEVVSNVSRVFDTTKGSMLSELMNNLKKAVNSFDYIEGIPEQVTAKLTLALSNIEKAAEKATQAQNSSAANTSALKNQLGKSIVTKLNSQVDKVVSKISDLEEKKSTLSSEEQKKLEDSKDAAASMCQSMGTLLDGLDSQAPEACGVLGLL